jgi:hypothetical protein
MLKSIYAKAILLFRSRIVAILSTMFLALGVINRLYDPFFLNSALPYGDSYGLLTDILELITYQKIIGVRYYSNLFSYFLSIPTSVFGLNPICVVKWFGPILGVLLFLLSFYILNRVLSNKYSTLLGIISFSSAFPLKWLFLRSNITRAEGVGLFVFAIVVVLTLWHQKSGKNRHISLAWILFIVVLLLDPLPAIALFLFLAVYEVLSRSKHWRLRLSSILLLLFSASLYQLFIYGVNWGFEKSFSIFMANLFGPQAIIKSNLFDAVGYVLTVLSFVGIGYTLITKERRWLPLTITWLTFFALLYVPIYCFSFTTMPFIIVRLESFFELCTLFQAAIGFEALLNCIQKIKDLPALNAKKVSLSVYVDRTKIFVAFLILFLVLSPTMQHSFTKYVDSTGMPDEDYDALLWLSFNQKLTINSSLIVFGSRSEIFGLKQSDYREAIVRATFKSDIYYFDVSDWPRFNASIDRSEKIGVESIFVMISVTYENCYSRAQEILLNKGFTLIYHKGALIFSISNKTNKIEVHK